MGTLGALQQRQSPEPTIRAGVNPRHRVRYVCRRQEPAWMWNRFGDEESSKEGEAGGAQDEEGVPSGLVRNGQGGRGLADQ